MTAVKQPATVDAHMAEQNASMESDECEAYDRKHGRTTDADAMRPSGLSEGGNKAAPEHVSFKITTSK